MCELEWPDRSAMCHASGALRWKDDRRACHPLIVWKSTHFLICTSHPSACYVSMCWSLSLVRGGCCKIDAICCLSLFYYSDCPEPTAGRCCFMTSVVTSYSNCPPNSLTIRPTDVWLCVTNTCCVFYYSDCLTCLVSRCCNTTIVCDWRMVRRRMAQAICNSANGVLT